MEAVTSGGLPDARDVFWTDGNGHDSWTCDDGAQDTVETAAVVVAVVGGVVYDGKLPQTVAGGWGREVGIRGASSMPVSGGDGGMGTEMGIGTGALAYGPAIGADEKGGNEGGAFAGEVWGRAPLVESLGVPGTHCGEAVGGSVGDGGVGGGERGGSGRTVGLSAVVDDFVDHAAEVAGDAGDGLFDLGLDVLELVCKGEGGWSALADALYEGQRRDLGRGEEHGDGVFAGDGGDKFLVALVEELVQGFNELFARRTDVFSVDTRVTAHGPLAGRAYPQIRRQRLCKRGRWRVCHANGS